MYENITSSLLGTNVMYREYIKHALEVFESKKCYVPELMRTLHLSGMLQREQGNYEEAKVLIERATSLFRKTKRRRKEPMPDRDLTQKDFDASVTFWSR